jgi:hypothetical protein
MSRIIDHKHMFWRKIATTDQQWGIEVRLHHFRLHEQVRLSSRYTKLRSNHQDAGRAAF